MTVIFICTEHDKICLPTGSTLAEQVVGSESHLSHVDQAPGGMERLARVVAKKIL